jgi:hypothetical protein
VPSPQLTDDWSLRDCLDEPTVSCPVGARCCRRAGGAAAQHLPISSITPRTWVTPGSRRCRPRRLARCISWLLVRLGTLLGRVAAPSVSWRVYDCVVAVTPFRFECAGNRRWPSNPPLRPFDGRTVSWTLPCGAVALRRAPTPRTTRRRGVRQRHRGKGDLAKTEPYQLRVLEASLLNEQEAQLRVALPKITGHEDPRYRHPQGRRL